MIDNLACQTNDLRYYTYLRFGYFQYQRDIKTTKAYIRQRGVAIGEVLNSIKQANRVWSFETRIY